MSDDLIQGLSKCSDGELARRLQNEKDYTPEAIEAMRLVLRERGYTEAEVGELRRGSKGIPEDSAALETNKAKYPVGIGGWLAVFPVILLFGLAQNILALSNDLDPVILLAIIIGITIQIVLLVGLFQKRPGYPRLAKWILGIYGGMQVIALLIMGNPSLALISAAGTVLWISYFNLSRRVRATFGQITESTEYGKQLFCTECSEAIPKGAQYCPVCGGKFESENPDAVR